jgi:hypothetical protein
MRGKLYKYDKQSGKVVEILHTDVNMIHAIPMPEGYLPPASNLVGVGIMSDSPVFEAGEFTPEHKDNIQAVFRIADKEAEKQDRRDCVRIQSQIERLRQRFDIPE